MTEIEKKVEKIKVESNNEIIFCKKYYEDKLNVLNSNYSAQKEEVEDKGMSPYLKFIIYIIAFVVGVITSFKAIHDFLTFILFPVGVFTYLMLATGILIPIDKFFSSRNSIKIDEIESKRKKILKRF